MISFWERESLLKWDKVIVGGGLLGLWTAYHSLKANPSEKVCILERGLFSSGASTKNAGFACFGSLSEIVDDIKLMGKAETLEQILERKRGIDAIEKLLGPKVDFIRDGGTEILLEEHLDIVSKLEEVNKWL